MAISSEFKHTGSPLSVPPVDAVLLTRICSSGDFEFVAAKLGPARARQLRWTRFRIFHSAMMILSRHIRAVSEQDWSSTGLAAGQIVLAEWRARVSWLSAYARGAVQLAGVRSIGIEPAALRVFDALATITGQVR